MDNGRDAVTYLLVTADELSLPIAEADSLSALARLVGVTKQNVYICHRRGWKIAHRYRVEVVHWD